MKNHRLFFLILLLTVLLVIDCTKAPIPEKLKPRLFITIKDDAGKSISGATVRLYKNAADSGITQKSDSTGVVIFSNLDTTLYYWLAQKGCSTNRTSQTTLNRPLVPNAILYGYSVLAENGALKIINNSAEPYKVSDSTFNIIIKKDTPYFAWRRVRSYLLRTEKVSTPGVGKDSIIKIKCGDTAIINIPY